ncbi:MAG TPA: hypothetical protein VF008_02580 [Niastella sp.]
MKNFLWAVALCQVFFSCKKDEDPYLKFTETNVKVSHFDTTFDIAIQSNVDWYVSVYFGSD